MSLTAKFLSVYSKKHKSRKSLGSPNFPRASITQYTSTKHEQILNSLACATESESGIIVNHNEKSRLCTEYYLRGVRLDERSLWTCSSCYLLLATWNNCCFSTVMAVSRKFQSVLFVCGQTWESTVPKEEELLEHFMCEYEKACTWCGTFKLKRVFLP